MPDTFEGVVAIEWAPSRGAILAGWHCAVTLDGALIPTVTALSVYASTEGPVWAQVTMFADADGRPVFDGKPVVKDEEILTGTFPFLVKEMRLRPAGVP